MASKDRTRRAERVLRSDKLPDRALVLTLVGLALLVPPLAGAFQLDLRLGGVPFTAVYLFVVWAALIVGAALLSHRLGASEPQESPLEPGEGA